MHEKDLLLSSYDYDLPKNLIADYPLIPKEKAKLLVYERAKNKITHSTFAYLSEFLPDCAIFFNDTKVIKARIFGHKENGALCELFLHQNSAKFEFLVQIKGRVKKGDILYFEKDLKAHITELLEGGFRKVYFTQNKLLLDEQKVFALFDLIGHIPLPPYIKRKDEKSDEEDYQSIFAKNLGAIAAPTASLHFSKESIQNLALKHKIQTITLHIGAGTFKSVECENLRDFRMHAEFFNISDESAKIINSQENILGIGTTVTRTIEYFVRTGKKSGYCDLFLNPFNKPLRQNFLLTNFHLPKSTLIMLVSAFIGREKTLELYEKAIKEKYRFYSYGDAMLIL